MVHYLSQNLTHSYTLGQYGIGDNRVSKIRYKFIGNHITPIVGLVQGVTRLAYHKTINYLAFLYMAISKTQHNKIEVNNP